jgi:hypothetical protein
MLKAALTSSAAFIVTLHEPIPLQAPLQPQNSDPEAGEAVSVRAAPVAKLSEHDVPQLMPAGLLITVPLALPASNTDRV